MEYGCIGERLTHSFSKEIHSYFGDYKYELTEIEKGNLDSFLSNRDFKAINVTIPYKKAVIPFLDVISEAAENIGAVNTIVNKNGKLYGYNTDFFGMRLLFLRAGIEVKGRNAFILGTGGTSKTAAEVLRSLGAVSITKVSRQPSGDEISYEQLYENPESVEIIVNTTPVGMFPSIDASPVRLESFCNLCGVIDAVYNPICTRLILEAKERKIKCSGGLFMLVAQAAYAYELFFDRELPSEIIENTYLDILEKKENIVLVGMPASGKTSVGTLLSERLGRELIDTDELIVRENKKPISDIFSENGEGYFRDEESRVICTRVAMQNGRIIATGGGSVLRKENVEHLKMNGKLYFLDRPLELLIPTDSRPLSSNRADMEKRYNERIPIYRAVSDVHIDASGTVIQVADAIMEERKKWNR